MGDERQKIVSDERFVETTRDLGLTTVDAVNEMVDNSFDANADNIWITLGVDDKERMFMIVEDDGEGIPSDKLAKALSFGGRLPSRKGSTGKFGWGLSSAACCQSIRTEVYSKHIEGDRFSYNYIDINELKENGGELPETVEKDPFEDYELNLDKNIEGGTIIILKNLDRPDRSKVDSLSELIEENLAEVQRKFLAEGKSTFVNGKEVKFRDPLMLMDGFDGIEECGKGENYADIEPIVYENITDEEGNSAEIKIRVSMLPVETILKNKLQKKYGISTANQGFYLMRNKRQIAGGLTLYLFTRHDQLNYFRAEISFPPCLDEKFGIQTNKSRFSLKGDLREKLEDRIRKVITQLRQDIPKERNRVRQAEQKRMVEFEQTLSEKIADKASRRLKPSGHKVTGEEREEMEREKKNKIQEVKKQKLPPDQEKEYINQIEMNFQKERTFKKMVDTIGTGEFYNIKHKGNRIEVIINQAHGFYRKIYERATQHAQLQILLDLFLFTLAQAEDLYYDNKEVKNFYNDQRREWSSIMSKFLETAEEEVAELKEESTD